MSAEFAVFVEGQSGKPLVLRRGFDSREAAEDHPVRLSQWKRVWVDLIEPIQVRRDAMPPKPWSVLWIGGFAYVIDADRNKIATIYGSAKRKEHVASAICEAFGDTA